MNSGVALLVRSLRLQSRAAAPHAARVALMVLLCLMLLSTSEMWERGGAAGRYVLQQVAWCLALVGTFAGIPLFAAAIAEEKEEGNIGLLRMAGLGRTGLLLGVGLARLWDMLLLSACALPVAVLAVTLGGVALEQVLAIFASLAAWFCCLAGLGLAASTVASTATRAGSLVVVVLLGLHLAPVFLFELSHDIGWQAGRDALAAWLDLTIWARLAALGATTSPGTWWHAQMAVDLGLGASGFVLAWLAFPRFARDGHEGGGAAAGGPAAGGMRRRLPIGRPRSGLAAIAWKDFHADLGGWRMLIIKLVVAVILALVVAQEVRDDWNRTAQIGNAWQIVAIAWLVVETGIHLSRLWSGEVRAHTAELLLMLPASWDNIAYAKLLVLPAVLAPALVLFAVGFLLSPGGFFIGLKNALSSMAGWYVITLVVFWWHSCAYLSLRWPRFAIAGSLIVMVAIQFGAVLLAMATRGEMSLIIVILVLAVVTFGMHLRIAARWAARAVQGG